MIIINEKMTYKSPFSHSFKLDSESSENSVELVIIL